MSCDLIVLGVNRLHVDYNADASMSALRGEKISFGFGFDINKSVEDNRQFKVSLRAKFWEHKADMTPLGFSVEAVLTGVVRVRDGIPDEKIAPTAQLNGIQLLYGAMRGIVLSVTGAFPTGPMLLRAFTTKEILDSISNSLKEKESQKIAPKETEHRVSGRSRVRKSPAEEGVASANRVFGEILEKADPKAAKKR